MVTMANIEQSIQNEKAARDLKLKAIVAEGVMIGNRYKSNYINKTLKKIYRDVNKLLGLEDTEKNSRRNLAAQFRRLRRG